MNIASGKLALRYSGRELEAMKAVASSAKARSLKEFQVVHSGIQFIAKRCGVDNFFFFFN